MVRVTQRSRSVVVFGCRLGCLVRGVIAFERLPALDHDLAEPPNVSKGTWLESPVVSDEDDAAAVVLEGLT